MCVCVCLLRLLLLIFPTANRPLVLARLDRPTLILHLGHGPLPRSQPGLLRLPVTASSLPRYVDGLARQCSEGKHRCGRKLKQGLYCTGSGGFGLALREPPCGFGPPRTGLRLRCPAFLVLPLFSAFRPFCPGQQQLITRERDSPTRNQLLAGTAWPQWFLALSTSQPATARHIGVEM